MANLVTKTEALDDGAVWSLNSVTVTANTFAAPSFAGPLAGLADTAADNSASAQGNVVGTFYDIAADAAEYVGSWHVAKDGITTRWPEIIVNINSGVNGMVSINTNTGAIADGSSPPLASGVVDLGTYWRVWMRIANNGSGTAIRIYCYPDHLDALGGSPTSSPTGSVILWGANITPSHDVLPYEPDPFYPFVVSGAALLLGVG